MKITYLDKEPAADPENPDVPTQVVEAADLNEIKTVVNENDAREPFTKFVGHISQTGTGEPDLVELHSNIGQPAIASRNGVGDYEVAFAGDAFVENSTIVLVGTNAGATMDGFVLAHYTPSGSLQFRTFDLTGAATDGILKQFPFEIRVYTDF